MPPALFQPSPLSSMMGPKNMGMPMPPPLHNPMANFNMRPPPFPGITIKNYNFIHFIN